MTEIIVKMLPYAQIAISIFLIIVVLLQQTGVGDAGGVFGGGNAAQVKSTRRGVEKSLLRITTVLGVLFFLTSVLAVYLK